MTHSITQRNVTRAPGFEKIIDQMIKNTFLQFLLATKTSI